MNALIRKDRNFLIFLAIVGTIVLTVTFANEDFEELWLFPVRGSEMVYSIYFSLGFTAGFAAAAADELLRTKEYLLHRPISPRRIHAAKWIGGGLLLTSWMILPPLFHWATELCFGYHVRFLQIGNLFDVWLHAIVMFSTFAMTLCCASLPCNWLWRAVALTAGVFALISLGSLISTTDRSTDPFTWFAFHAIATAVLAAASFAVAERVADPDRPWPWPIRRGAIVVVSMLAISTTLAIATLQQQLIDELDNARPRIVRFDDSRAPRLALRVEGSPRHRIDVAATEDHAATTEALPGATTLWRSFSMWGSYGMDVPHLSAGASQRSAEFSAVVDRRAGTVRIAWSSDMYWRFDSFETLGRGGDGRFSPGAKILDTPGSGNTVWVTDSDALWRVDRAGEPREFRRVDLPDGDRIQRVRSLRVDSGRRDALAMLLSHDRTSVVVGERATYRLTDRIEPAPAELLAAEAARADDSEFEAIVTHIDPIAPVVRVDGPDGTVFEHDFAPKTALERLFAASAVGVSALRPPVLSIASWALVTTEQPSAARQPLFDPLCVNHRRPWLIALTLGLAVLCALWMRRTLRRRGAAADVLRFWTILTVILGPTAALAALAIETRRAHVRVPHVAPRLPLIRSA